MDKKHWCTLVLGAVAGFAQLTAQTTYQNTAPHVAPPPPQVAPQQQSQPVVQPSGQVLDAAAQAKLDQDLADTANVGSQWLKLVDEGKYGDSWDFGSKTFQFTIKRDEWIKAQNEIRKPYGSLVSRKLVDQRTAKDPKGLPAGEYMVLIYESSFSNHPKAGELLTMVKESDGKWRPLTYQAHY